MKQFSEEDDIDYEQLKAQRKADRESIKEFKDTLKIDQEDLFAKLAQAATGAVEQVSSQSAESPKRLQAQSMNKNAIGGSYQGHSKYAEIEEVLDRFAFSTDIDKRKKQLKTISSAIKQSLNELILEDVANNTKLAFKKYAKKVYKVPGGLKVLFNFDGTKYEVTAKGAFTGSETICIHSSSNKVKPAVIQVDDDGHEDLSPNYDITLKRV